MTGKEKERVERQKVEGFISGSRCRRIYLDHEMDGRIDRVGCEDGEERCDICCRSDDIVIDSNDDREEFQYQQLQRQQQRLDIQESKQQAGHEVWDLENRLDMWVGKCPLCYIRKCTGRQVNIRHTLDECVDEEQELVCNEVAALEGVYF